MSQYYFVDLFGNTRLSNKNVVIKTLLSYEEVIQKLNIFYEIIFTSVENLKYIDDILHKIFVECEITIDENNVQLNHGAISLLRIETLYIYGNNDWFNIMVDNLLKVVENCETRSQITEIMKSMLSIDIHKSQYSEKLFILFHHFGSYIIRNYNSEMFEIVRQLLFDITNELNLQSYLFYYNFIAVKHNNMFADDELFFKSLIAFIESGYDHYTITFAFLIAYISMGARRGSKAITDNVFNKLQYNWKSHMDLLEDFKNFHRIEIFPSDNLYSLRKYYYYDLFTYSIGAITNLTTTYKINLVKLSEISEMLNYAKNLLTTETNFETRSQIIRLFVEIEFKTQSIKYEMYTIPLLEYYLMYDHLLYINLVQMIVSHEILLYSIGKFNYEKLKNNIKKSFDLIYGNKNLNVSIHYKHKSYLLILHNMINKLKNIKPIEQNKYMEIYNKFVEEYVGVDNLISIHQIYYDIYMKYKNLCTI